MAKRNTSWTENKIEKYIKEGRGEGEGENYKPWITIQDVPSMGLSTRGTGWKTNRIHHFLSKLERDYFYMCEWETDVIDIREQYPLSRLDTISYSEKKNLKHPTDPKTLVPIVMTTDFLLTVRTEKGIQHVARTIKPSSELDKVRILEKFEIERHYWSERNVDWGIVTEKEISQTLVQNVEWIHSSHNLDEFLPTSSYKILSEELKYNLQLKGVTVIEIIHELESKWKLENGLVISLFQHLISIGEIVVNMNKPLILDQQSEEIVIGLNIKTAKG